MTPREELELILTLIKKHSLPLSPILEYAIKEKMEQYVDTVKGIDDKSTNTSTQSVSFQSNKESMDTALVDVPTDSMKIVDYGDRSIAVIGETKPHKEDLKSLGGYFVFRTQWGPAWVFSAKKRDKIQAYIDGNVSVVSTSLKGLNENDHRKSRSRYIISVKYPNGRVFCSNIVWETLVDVIKYAGPKRVMDLNINCMGDNLVSPRLNSNYTYRSAQKDIGGGLYVCAYSSTDIKYRQIIKINVKLKLGLKIKKIDTFKQ